MRRPLKNLAGLACSAKQLNATWYSKNQAPHPGPLPGWRGEGGQIPRLPVRCAFLRLSVPAQSTYKNSFELKRTWQKSTNAFAFASRPLVVAMSQRMWLPFGEESLKKFGSSNRQ